MKKVRFESPDKVITSPKMNESDCHSPRPYVERHIQAPEVCYDYPRVLPYTSDPVERFECGNSSPYPTVNKTTLLGLHKQKPTWSPSNDLELSMLDASDHEPRIPIFHKPILKTVVNGCIDKNISEHNFGPQVLSSVENNFSFNQSYPGPRKSVLYEQNGNMVSTKRISKDNLRPVHILPTIENKSLNPSNILSKDSNFFIRRDNINEFRFDIHPLPGHLNRLSLGKENDPLLKKAEIMKMGTLNSPLTNLNQRSPVSPNLIVNDECRCHHCIKIVNNTTNHLPHMSEGENMQKRVEDTRAISAQCHCVPQPSSCSHCSHNVPLVRQSIYNTCKCQTQEHAIQKPLLNAIDKKSWMIEKYEQNKQADCMEVEKQRNIVKEKREPTVSDLFKIIKLQNEQLQLLQEKVDKFISASKPTVNAQAVQNNVLSEHISLATVGSEHKISIGVMTSFEMVRTSTINYKEVVKQTNDKAQIQCNQSHISIKEVVSKPVNLNFLDGIAPVSKAVQSEFENECNALSAITAGQQTENVFDEKTLNEQSLYNVQVDNATTPLMSPEQSLYLDVRDYSDSEAGSDDQSNVGWTYYNKVMTHVNGMLQDSDMPSSASALYRNTRQQCVQMQIDKTNVSVTKRVKFGDDPLGIHQPHIFAATSTDTSLKMNQLAAKYLKNGSEPLVAQRPTSKPSAAPIDMSFATRNYMERHKLLQGVPQSSKYLRPGEMPKFLDITALKRQPKLL